jgi:hypothetical protein
VFCGVAASVQVEIGSSGAAEALGAVALSGDAESADFLADRLYDEQVSTEQWRRDFQKYFGTGTFTVSLGLFWESAVSDADEGDQARIGSVSALCACEAVKAALPRAVELPAAYDSLAMAFRWLQYASPALDAGARSTVFDALAKAFGASTLGSFARQPRQYAFYVQAALTLGEYADARGRDSVGKLLGLAPAALAMWQSFGVLVFDNGAYGARHYESLASLLRAIPPRLHAIRAIIVPEATGIAPGAAFITSGQIVYLPYVAMDVYTSPLEFLEYRGLVAPRFTAIAAQEIVRAIQAVQFWKRPELLARRDIILANAQYVGARYLRHYRMVPPQVYANNPDELLPALAYIYAIDSRTVFRMALALFLLHEQEAVDQYLLLADLLSDGGSTAPLLATSLDGAVSSASAALGRVHGNWVRAPNPSNANLLYANPAVPVDLWFCNAISYQNTKYVFEFDDRGITTRYLR